MEKDRKNRRKYDRYETDLKIQFSVSFDVETKIDYRVKSRDAEKYPPQKYHALSRNVSAEGLCFTSKRKLNHGDQVLVEIFLPLSEAPIPMEGEVRWSRLFEHQPDSGGPLYETGILLEKVDGRPVKESIFTDRENRIVWSTVLESVFGSFKHLARSRKNNSNKPQA